MPDFDIIDIFAYRHRHQHHHDYDRRRFAVSVIQSAPFTLQGRAEYPDPQNPGQFLVDPNATATWQEDSAGVACALSGQTDSAGVSQILVTPALDLGADTVVNVTGYATDIDGHATPISDPYTFTVPAAVVPPSTDATQFVIDGVVTPEVPAAAVAAPAGPPTVDQINAAEAAATGGTLPAA